MESYSKTDEYKEKYKNTCMKKYGVNTPFKSIEIRDKIKNTCLEKYGVDNPLKSKEIREKIKQTLLDKYGVINGYHVSQDQFYSKISQELFWKIYNRLPDDLKSYCYFAELNKEYIIKTTDICFSVDFVLLKNNKCIEFNGDFWHMNPKIYNEDDYNSITKLTAKQQWEKDAKRIEILNNRKIDLCVIWEYEYTNNTQQLIDDAVSFLLT